MSKSPRIFAVLSSLVLIILTSSLITAAEPQAIAELRGEIRVVESWRPDINVLGHNVLQYLYEYALDRNKLVPCLAVSHRWVDDTTLELKLREGVQFHNGETFDAHVVKFNFEYQRQHNPGRGVQVYMRNVKRVQDIDPFTVQVILEKPDSLFLDKLIIGPDVKMLQ
jgi:ABC-type transport system substrate-binding protein